MQFNSQESSKTSVQASTAQVPKEPVTRDAAFDLAEYVVKTSYENLPPALVGVVKKSILDTLGVVTAASTLDPAAKTIAELIKEGAGKKESTVLGFGGKVPCWMAAFINGSMGHMIDYDDIHEFVMGHPSITTVLPGMAIAERLGNVNGRDFITAVALGNDIITRLGRAIKLSPQGRDEWTMDKGWFSTQLFGFISGAATVGKLLRLNQEQMVYALGIASAQLSGCRQMGTGFAAETRAIMAGWTGKGAVLSALMAQRGVTGAKDSIEGSYGVFRVYLQAKPDRDSLVGELGKRFDGINQWFKAWPACGETHSSIYSTTELMRENNISAADVEEIRVIGGTPHVKLLSEPIQSKRKPQASIDAKYSIPFTVAVAAAKGNVALRDYSAEGLKDPIVLRMAERVSHQYIPEIANKREYEEPTIEIRTKAGKVYSRRDSVFTGKPGKPVTKEKLVEKFRDCVSFAAKPVSKANVEKIIETVDQLENLDNVGQIMRLIV
ncbi:MAG: MmgE/PrpD family protein [Betaproteobacteria bacterium]|nr:MmgE/PrpD family protein [Betaproteobacteria bacterium]